MPKVKIEELLEKTTIEDSNLMIVEDEADTKKATIHELKRAFMGDEPDDYTFYTSRKVDDLVTGLRYSLSEFVNRDELDKLQQEVTNITSASGTDITEVVAARGTYKDLNSRLEGDKKENDNKYMSYPTVSFFGLIIDLSDIEMAKTSISCPTYTEDTKLLIEGKNKYTYGDPTGLTGVSKVNSHGLKITYTQTANSFKIPIGKVLPAGDYVFYATCTLSDNFARKGSVLKIHYTDSSTLVVSSFNYTSKTRFTAEKTFNAFEILPETVVDGMTCTLDDIMISEDDSLEKFHPYCDEAKEIKANQVLTYNANLQRCILRRAKVDSNGLVTQEAGMIQAEVVDTSFNGAAIKEELEEIKEYTTASEDYCGLLENKGDYHYAVHHMVNNSPNRCAIGYDHSKKRNGKDSVRIKHLTYEEGDNPRFTLLFDTAIDMSNAQSISLQLYIDKTVSEKFANDDGIKIMLSSDPYTVTNPANPNVNYIYFNIGRQSFVQGWNTIKIRMSKFLKNGNCNLKNITQVNFRLFTSKDMENRDIWINSVIIDQRMRPVVLFAFNDFNEDGFDYTYPYLYNKGIPVTIFANNKHTFTKEFLNKLATLHYQYGWELANNGCNPNNELLIHDDNAKDQYQAIKNSKQWFSDNFTDNVTSYLAPFNNLRPITESILRELGFKIATEEVDQYCSLFTAKDLVIPCHMLSNAENKGADEVIKKIDEIVETGQVLCIYTESVSRYGSNIGATTVSFEAVVTYVKKLFDNGVLDCMTFQQFTDQCLNR